MKPEIYGWMELSNTVSMKTMKIFCFVPAECSPTDPGLCNKIGGVASSGCSSSWIRVERRPIASSNACVGLREGPSVYSHSL